MGAPEHLAIVREMCCMLDEQIAETRYRGDERLTGPLDATLLSQGPGHWLYECALPPGSVVPEDAEVAVSAGGQHATGRVVRVERDRCAFTVAQPLGSRIGGWLAIDGTELAESLRARLIELAASGSAPGGLPFRFDLATLVLRPPGGRLQDGIALAAESADTWNLEDPQADLLRNALRYRSAYLQGSPGADSVAVLARLLDRLLELGATVLFTGPSSDLVDRTVLALCRRLTRRVGPRSGIVHRVGPIGLPELRERYGALVDPEEIAADLRDGVDQRVAALSGEDLRLQLAEATARYDEVHHRYVEVVHRLDRARERPRLLRLGGGERPDELIVEMHKVRAQVNAARADRDRMLTEVAATELAAVQQPAAADGTVPDTAGSTTARRRQIAEQIAELQTARGEIEQTLRRRCRLVATTSGQAVVRPLPRHTFDVVVLAGPVDPPLAFYLAGLASRSVIRVGGPDRLLETPPAAGRPAEEAQPEQVHSGAFSRDLAARLWLRRGSPHPTPR